MSKELVAAMQRESKRKIVSPNVRFPSELNSEHHDVAEQINVCEDLFQQLSGDFDEIEAELKNLKDLLAQANETNVELHRHVTKIFEHLKILHSPLEQLERSLPTINELDGKTKRFSSTFSKRKKRV